MIRILLVDDQKTILYGIKALLETQQDFEIVGLAENGQQAIDQAVSLKPDVALIDMTMPILNGAEATKAICQQCPNVKVLLLSASSDESTVRETISAGAMGYLLKDTSPDELAMAIRSIYKGSTHFGPGIFTPSILTTPGGSDSLSQDDLSRKRAEKAAQLKQLLNPSNEVQWSQFETFLESITSINSAQKLEKFLEQSMQQQPENWRLWYLASTLQHEVIRNPDSALNYCLTGFEKALNAQQPLEVLIGYCNQAMKISSSALHDCCSRLLQQHRSDNTVHLLLRSAYSQLSSESKCYKCLVQLWQIRELDELLSSWQRFQAS